MDGMPRASHEESSARLCVIGVLFLLVTAVADLRGQIFDNRAEFEASLGPVVTIDFEGFATQGGNVGVVELEGDEFPGITLTPADGAVGLFVGIPELGAVGGDFFAAGGFRASSGVALLSPELNVPPLTSPNGSIIVDFASPTDAVGGFFVDAELPGSSLEVFDGPGGTGDSLGRVTIEGQEDASLIFAGIRVDGLNGSG